MKKTLEQRSNEIASLIAGMEDCLFAVKARCDPPFSPEVFSPSCPMARLERDVRQLASMVRGFCAAKRIAEREESE